MMITRRYILTLQRKGEQPQIAGYYFSLESAMQRHYSDEEAEWKPETAVTWVKDLSYLPVPTWLHIAEVEWEE